MEIKDNDIEHQNDIDGSDATVNGKFFLVTIRWRNITCSLSDESSILVLILCGNVGGEAKLGRLLAIIGPSGSRKTNLLKYWLVRIVLIFLLITWLSFLAIFVSISMTQLLIFQRDMFLTRDLPWK